MYINTQCCEWVELLTSNSTAASFTALAATATEPTGAGVIDLPLTGDAVNSFLQLIFFGAGADNSTFDARVSGWSKVDTLWVPTPLVEVSCTLGAAVGVASQAVLDTERFADTLSLAAAYSGLAGSLATVVSPAGDLVARLLLDLQGFRKFQVQFDMTGATSGNAIYKRF